jgi:hypothetical protein
MSENAVKKYIIRLSGAERETLEALIRTGKRSAAQVLKARIDPAQGRYLRGWRRVSDRRIVTAQGHQPVDRIADALTPGRRRSRSGLAPQAVSQLRQAAHLRRCGGGQTYRPGPFGTPQGSREVDLAAVGAQGRGIEHRPARQRQHDWPNAKKTFSSRT